jgi:hypothetical protein
MDISEFISIAKTVLADKRVIGTAIAVFLCMDFGAFVVNYTKKPVKSKHSRTKVKPVPAAEKNNGGTESSSAGNTENKRDDSSSKSDPDTVSEK